MMLREHFVELEQRTGRAFTLDACCNDDGSNAHCARFCSPRDSFLSLSSLAGQHVWMNPPYSNISAFLRHYLQLKMLSPHSVSGCFVVPKWLGQRWRKLLTGMQLLKQYEKGTVLFSAPRPGGARAVLPGVRWAVEVWYDPPAPAFNLTVAMRAALTMRFKAKLSGADACVLVDSGASDMFLDKRFAARAGLRVKPARGAGGVTLGDGQASVDVVGSCMVHVRMQGYSARVRVWVVEALLEGFDLVLGDSWLAAVGACLDYRHRRCIALAGNRRVTLKPIEDPPAPLPPPPPLEAPTGADHGALTDALPAGDQTVPSGDVKVLSALQMKRELKHAKKERSAVFLLNLRHVGEASGESGPPDKPATPADTGLMDPQRLAALLREFEDVFPEELPEGLPPARGVEHVVRPKPGAKPVSRPLYRMSPVELEEVRRQVKDLLTKGLIEPSSSPWGAPCICVRKPQGGFRICQDYRALNAACERSEWPLPLISDLLDATAGKTVFSSLDLMQGYYQILIREEDRPYTAFKTPLGLYQFKVLPFGLQNAPATFQQLMHRIFGDLILTPGDTGGDTQGGAGAGSTGPAAHGAAHAAGASTSACSRCVLVYLDDVLVLSRTPEEHETHLRELLARLRQWKLYAKAAKCDFNKPELKFLGHIVGRDGLKVDPAKTAALRDMAPPTDVSALRSFLGLANYFRRFLKDYAKRVAPLTSLTGAKAVWRWGSAEQEAFDWVKQALTDPPTLAAPDFRKPFTVTVDASIVGIGATLEQEGRPVAYESRKLSPAERNYITTDQELLAVVHALRVWRCYLENGCEFLVRTDHNPNTYFSSKAQLSRREARWAEFLSGFTFKWQYLPGKTNAVADVLSRQPVGPEQEGEVDLPRLLHVMIAAPVLAALTRAKAAREAKAQAELVKVTQEWTEQVLAQGDSVQGTPLLVKQGYKDTGAGQSGVPQVPKDGQEAPRAAPREASAAPRGQRAPRSKSTRGDLAPTPSPADSQDLCRRIREAYAGDPWFKDPQNTVDLELRDGLWWKGDVIVVPDCEALKDTILSEVHDAPYSGHGGKHKTLGTVKRLFWWPRLRPEVEAWVKTCDACQRNKGDRRKKGLLQPLPVPSRAWEHISFDLITQLPVSRDGFDAILVFVDRLTKMVHFVPTHTTVTSEQLAKLFVRHVWKLHGLPRSLVCDRDPRWAADGSLLRAVLRMVGSKLRLSTAYHPETDGQTERYNRVLEDMLRAYTSPAQDDWADLLDLAEFAVNNSWQETVRETPFFLNYGQHPLTPVAIAAGAADHKSPEAKALVERIRDGIARARQCMAAAQDREAAYANKSRMDVAFDVGQPVMLHVKNLRLVGSKKLLPRWLGPFPVQERIGPVAYRLELPSSLGKIHPVFHVSLLKPYHASGRPMEREPPPIELEGEDSVFEVERILDHRLVRKGGRERREYKILWQGYSADKATWEPEGNLVLGADELLREYWRSLGKAPPDLQVAERAAPRKRKAKDMAPQTPARRMRR